MLASVECWGSLGIIKRAVGHRLQRICSLYHCTTEDCIHVYTQFGVFNE